MKHAEYKQLSERTLSDYFFATDEDVRYLLHGAIGIVTELGELSEAIQKDDKVNIGEEIADIMWYLAIFDRHYNLEQDEAREEVEVDDDLFIAASELLDVFKKKLYYNRDIDGSKVLLNVNFIHDCVYSLCDAYDLDIYQLRAKNIEKLQARFPEKFTVELANNRNLEVERSILES